jgi:cytoskeletal protein RodZ
MKTNEIKSNNEFFKEKNIEELSLSELFKKEREARNLDIKQLSVAAGVSTSNLKMIESGRWKDLPSEIYTKNFLSKCAKVFLIDENIFLDLYVKEAGIKNNNEKIERISKRSFLVTPKIVAGAVFALFVVVVVVYFVFQMSYLLGNPQLFVTSPEYDIITEVKEIEISGTTQHDNKVTINDNDVFVDADGHFSEMIPLQPGINNIRIKAINRLNKESVIIRKIILEE